MRRRRSAGSLLDVLKAQHFDPAISLARRVAIKLARYKETGATNYDPQIVDGTIGNLVGSFLMQLVASPSVRPAYGHLWGLGAVPAIYNGAGKATPIFDSWLNQDADIEPLSVDIGTQTLVGGEYGRILRGTKDDDQSLVFLRGGTASGGSGGASPYGFAPVDGNVNFNGSTIPPLFMETGVSDPAILQGAFNAGAGGGGGPSTKYYLLRDIFCDTLTIAGGVFVFPQGHRIFAKTLTGGGVISGSPADYYDTTKENRTISNGGSNLGNSAGRPAAPSLFPSAPLLDGSGGSYGAGGAGGTSYPFPGPANPGGAGGSGVGGNVYNFPTIYQTLLTPTGLGGGAAGATGGSNGSAGFGQGGAGADTVVMIALSIQGCTIECKGAQPPDAPGVPQAGGGGGGGGGGGNAVVATLGGSIGTDLGGGLGGISGGFGATDGSPGSRGKLFLLTR